MRAAFAQLYLLASVALAMLLGGAIGLERELADKPAGMRTHMMLAGAAALLVGLGSALVDTFNRTLAGESLRVDPIRIIEAVVTGVSFLGAGTIIRRGAERHVEGLTTAASMLLVAAIGVCVALQQLVVAVGATALTLVVLRGLARVERWITRRRSDAP